MIIWRYGFLVLLCASLRLSAQVLVSPKGGELFPPRVISLMPQAVVLPPPSTNQTIRMHAEWPAGVAESYNLYVGTNSGSWPTLITNVDRLEVWFPMLVWPEDGPTIFHWFVVKSVLNGLESDPSPEARFPWMPPTHVVITWPEPGRATIWSTPIPRRDVFLLPPLTNSVKPLILPLDAARRFFASTNKLSITTTNF